MIHKTQKLSKEAYFTKVFFRESKQKIAYGSAERDWWDKDVVMEDDKSNDSNLPEYIQFNDLKTEINNMTNKEIWALVFSEIWSQSDQDQSLFKLTDQMEEFHIKNCNDGNRVLYVVCSVTFLIDNNEERKSTSIEVDRSKSSIFEFSDLQEFFINKKRWQRISPVIKLKLVLHMKSQDLSVKEIWRLYFLKSSEVKAILEEVSDYHNFRRKIFWDIYSHPLKRVDVREWVKEWLIQHQGGVTAKIIQDFINEKLQVKPTLFAIRSFLKKDLRLSYKKGCPRPANIQSNKISLLRILYSIRFSRVIRSEFLLINIDESTFSNSVWNYKSWLKKGVNCEILSERFKGSASLVLAITSEGDYFGAFLKSRLNSRSFIDFLSRLDDWIQNYLMKDDRNIVLILDNWSIHRSKETRIKMKQSRKKIWFIPPYSPSLAPVELAFAQLKRYVKTQHWIKSLSWNSTNGQALIEKGLALMKNSDIVGFWKHTTSVMNSYITNFHEKLKWI